MSPPETSSTGDVLGVDSSELTSLAKSATAAQTELESVARQAASIVGSLDGRGWNLGGVQSQWSSTRGKFGQLELTLGATSIELGARALLVEIFEKGPGFSAPTGSAIPGYDGVSLSDYADILFPSHGFQEAKFEKDMQLLLNGRPTGRRLVRLRGELSDVLLPTAASVAERARQLALHGSPAGVRRRINALDKLDPTLSYNVDLLDKNWSAFSWGAGGQNANVSLEVLAAHAHAAAGLSMDWKRRRFSASADIGVEANLIDVHAHAAVNVGNSMYGAGAEATGDAAVGANAEARAGLTMDALKGKVSGDLGADAFAGASAEAEGSVSTTVAGAKTAITGSATAYAGVGIGLKADGNFDLMHGKMGFNVNIGAALGIGAKFDLGMNIDVSGVPGAIGDAASSVGHVATSVAGDVADAASSAASGIADAASSVADTVKDLVPHVDIGPVHIF